jgi:hypothetical protein
MGALRPRILGAALLAAGCAATESVWIKPGATQQDFYQDRGQCQAQAFSIPNAPALQIAIVSNSCMQGKGWYTEERPVSR